MKPKEVEIWAVRVVEAVRASRRNEDSRVELKQQWVDAHKAARRIAGHLNASRGEAILWLIGVDEKDGRIDPVATEDLASWWDSVLSHFDGPRPRPVDVVIDDADGSYIALGMEGPLPPYVVKNPVHGEAGCGPVALEVPWREMTKVRTARHSDLIKILAPTAGTPEIEVLGASLTARGRYDVVSGLPNPPREGEPCTWSYELELYVVPADERAVVFPLHRTSIVALQADTFGEIALAPYVLGSVGSKILGLEDRDIAVNGPSRVTFMASATVDPHAGNLKSGAIVQLRVLPPWISRRLVVVCDFELAGDDRFELRHPDVWWTDS